VQYIKKIIVADHAGFCFGVKRAVDISLNIKKQDGGSVYTLGPLIHNDDVVNFLKAQGISQISIDDLCRLGEKDAVVIRSHGVTPETLKRIKRTGAQVIDATCPYVASIQLKVKKYHAKGYQIIIVGDKNHPEVIGINGWCGNTAIVTRDGTDLGSLPDKVCIVAQTTEKLSNFEKVVEAASKSGTEVLTFNTICSATKERQGSADEVSKKVDLMIVIGGKNSSNSKKLYDICRTNCTSTIFIENAGELPDWVTESKDIETVGVTAGASTPDWVIQEVLARLEKGLEAEQKGSISTIDVDRKDE